MSKIQSAVPTPSTITPQHIPPQSQPIALLPSPSVTMTTPTTIPTASTTSAIRPTNNIMIHALQRRPIIPGNLKTSITTLIRLCN